MPTATSLSGVALINDGPLTTTFTAPASCSTAYDTLIGLATDPLSLLIDAHCQYQPPADCYPSGYQSIISSAQGINPTDGRVVVYNSPGLYCPSSWSSVGDAAKINPTSTSISGAFNETYYFPQDVGAFEPLLDAFMAALDQGETAVVCCPSSYTTYYGGCVSTIPTSIFTPSGGCQLRIPAADYTTVYGTWTLGEQTVTAGLDSFTATSPVITVTTSISPSEATSYVGVAYYRMFVLVYQSSDIAAASTASSTSKTSAAVRVRGNRNGPGLMATICCVVGVLGALLMA